MSTVIESIHQEHVAMAKLLDALERQLVAIDTGETPDYDIVKGVIDYCLTYPDLHHHPKEDLVFEALRRRDPATAEVIGDLEAEHRDLADLSRRFAAAVQNVLDEAEISREAFAKLAWHFVGQYRHHMSLEERVFLPAAREALNAQDLSAIEAKLTHGHDPLFGDEPDEQFDALREEILRWDERETELVEE